MDRIVHAENTMAMAMPPRFASQQQPHGHAHYGNGLAPGTQCSGQTINGLAQAHTQGIQWNVNNLQQQQ
jgi:hypothetical protein